MGTKITPAVRKRLEQVKRGGIERTGYGWTHSYHTKGEGGLTYVMVDKLEQAGLIAWNDTGKERNRHIAVLTEGGAAALAPNTKGGA